jgi:hypothetical protein
LFKAEKVIINLLINKTATICRKLVTIAKKNIHNIGPWTVKIVK